MDVDTYESPAPRCVDEHARPDREPASSGFILSPARPNSETVADDAIARSSRSPSRPTPQRRQGTQIKFDAHRGFLAPEEPREERDEAQA